MKPVSRRKKREIVVIGPVPEIIGRIPRPYPPSQEGLGNLISKELHSIWMGILSEDERSAVEQSSKY